MRRKAAAFTGHRPESLPFGRDLDQGHFEEFQVVLWNEISRRMDEGYDTFYCGGARGIDLLCGEIVLAEKTTRHPNVKLICAIPYKEQAERWGWMWRQRYRIVFHVHDECVMEVPLGFGSVEEACAIMGQGPAWAEGLPLRADGYECSSYRKM